MKTIIFDIDGTLADLTHRLHYVKNGNRQWDKFFEECFNDKPIEAVCELLSRLYHTRCYNIVLVSGRSDIVRAQTASWLHGHNLWFHELFMRKDKDCRPDDIIKSEILDQLLAAGHDILFVVDDRQRVVDMWRKRGLVCLQAAAWEESKVSRPTNKGLLTLMVGPSGAGKSSFIQNFQNSFKHNIPELAYLNVHERHVLSSDLIRHDLCGDFRDQSKNDEVFATLHKVAKARIENGLPTIIDATNIKRADRIAAAKLAEESPVRYIVIDRPLELKYRDAGWRKDLPIDLIKKHHDTFQSQLKDILKGDNLPNVTVVDLRRGE